MPAARLALVSTTHSASVSSDLSPTRFETLGSTLARFIEGMMISELEPPRIAPVIRLCMNVHESGSSSSSAASCTMIATANIEAKKLSSANAEARRAR